MQVKWLRLHTLNVQKLIAIDIHYLNVLEIMNKELNEDIKRVAIALEKLVKLITKLMKEQNE